MFSTNARRRGPRESVAPFFPERLESRHHLSASAVRVGVAAEVPPVPGNFVVRYAGPGEHRVTWSNVFGETGFVVRRRVQGAPAFEDVAALPADTVSYVDLADPQQFPAGTTLEYELVAENEAGRSGSQGSRLIVVGGPGGTGLRQRIWDDIDPASAEPLGAVAVDRVDGIVNELWGEGPPAPGVGPDTFAVEWVGEIVAEETKAYDFSVMGDDGVRLFLDDKLVIAGAWRDQPVARQFFSEPVNLTARQRVKVRLQAYDRTGESVVQLFWNGANNAREPVPSVFLFPTVTADDEVAFVPARPVTFPEVFSLPETVTTPASVMVRWQDNAFGEGGYEIERATNDGFTEGLVRFVSARGSDQFIDDGGADAGGNPAPLVPGTLYHYRVRPVGAAGFVNVGSSMDAFAHWRWGEELTLAGFPSPEMVTVNGQASTTAEGSIKLTHNDTQQTSSAFINRAFDVGRSFYTAAFDFRIGPGNGPGGLAFLIHNAGPTQPGRAQVNALGANRTGLGYGGIPNSVAVVFDAGTLGVWTGGQVRPAGDWDDLPVGVKRDNSQPGTVHAPNGLIALPSTVNPISGRLLRLYVEPDGPGVLTLRITDPANVGPHLMLARFAIDLPAEIGGETAVMGWTAATGNGVLKTEVYNFTYRGLHGDPFPVSDVFVRGSAWSDPFKNYLDLAGLGHAQYGYGVYGVGRIPPARDPHDILPWINVDEIVLRYASAPTGSLVPTPQSVVVNGRGAPYTVTAVTPVAGDPRAYVLRLARPLGGGNPVTGLAPTPAENGDVITLGLPGGGAAGSNFTLKMNVLQGDTDHLGEGTNHVVLARDYSEVKKKFFKGTFSPNQGTDTDYTPWHDVDGSGQILARDYSEVKKRFFHTLSMPSFASAAVAAAPATPDGARRGRPEGRSEFKDLLA